MYMDVAWWGSSMRSIQAGQKLPRKISSDSISVTQQEFDSSLGRCRKIRISWVEYVSVSCMLWYNDATGGAMVVVAAAWWWLLSLGCTIIGPVLSLPLHCSGIGPISETTTNYCHGLYG